MQMLNPLDLKSALLAKHAQHVVLVHFPIALYLAGTAADFCARIFRKAGLLEVARWNFLAAAVLSIPTAATGILAWQWALEGQALKGILRFHLLLASVTVLALWITYWLRSRRNQGFRGTCPGWLLLAEGVVCALIAITAHLGGFLSGVNTGH